MFAADCAVAMEEKIFLSLIILLMGVFNSPIEANDYCGHPIPQDIARQSSGKPPDNPFADPYAQSSRGQQDQPLMGQVVYIPRGASLPVRLDRPVGSGISRVGDILYGRVEGGVFGIPPGSVAEMNVMMIEPASRMFARPGRIQIGANRLILPNGQSVWLRGIVIDRLGENQLKGESGGRRALKAAGKMALGAGLGTAAGAGIGAIADGKMGAAIATGAVIGVVIGGVWAALSKGQEITLPGGMPVLLNVTDGTHIMY